MAASVLQQWDSCLLSRMKKKKKKLSRLINAHAARPKEGLNIWQDAWRDLKTLPQLNIEFHWHSRHVSLALSYYRRRSTVEMVTPAKTVSLAVLMNIHHAIRPRCCFGGERDGVCAATLVISPATNYCFNNRFVGRFFLLVDYSSIKTLKWFKGQKLYKHVAHFTTLNKYEFKKTKQKPFKLLRKCMKKCCV